MLKLQNISKNYENFCLNNISLEIEKGDYLVLLGKSGSGKSMLCEIIAGIRTPDSGNIYFKDRNITYENIQNRKIVMLFQDFALFPHFNVRQNIEFSLELQKKSKKEIKQIVDNLAVELDIENLINQPIQKLSGGEKQRVALARALAYNPEILLLDEPLSSIDVNNASSIRQLLKKISNNGITIIHVTHDYEDALILGNKVAVLNNGNLVQAGKIDEVFQHPKNEFIAGFIGIKNYFRAKFFVNEGLAYALTENNIKFYSTSTEKQGDGFVLIHSEDIIINTEMPHSSARNILKGEIIKIQKQKHGYEITVNVGVELYVQITKKSVFELDLHENKTVFISFKASAVKFLK